MKLLFIGGTGTISMAISKQVITEGHELYLLNRGNNSNPEGSVSLIADIYDTEAVEALIKDLTFDVVVDFIAFEKAHVERDYKLFNGKTTQYIFISSASAYYKPIPYYPITESMPLGNKYWQYSDNKRICEEYLMRKHSESFNVTIVRPAHTYNDDTVIQNLINWGHQFTTIKRMIDGKPTIIPGNGRSLWTLTHNSDFAKAFVPLLGNSKAYGEDFHITSQFTYTWDDIHNIVCDALGIKPNIIHIPTDFLLQFAPWLEGELMGDKDWSLIFDNSKIKTIATDYVATVKYEDIAKKAVQKMLKDNDNQSIDHEYDKLLDTIIEQYKNN